MQRFTIFTVILAALVVVVMIEMKMNNTSPLLNGDSADGGLTYSLPDNLDLSQVMETNALGNQLDNKLGNDISIAKEEPVLPKNDFNNEVPDTLIKRGNEPISDTNGKSKTVIEEDFPDFEDPDYTLKTLNVALRDEQIKSAGFNYGYVQEELSDGYIFKTLYLGDLNGTILKKYLVRSDDTLYAKIYLISTEKNDNLKKVYDVIRERASKGLDSEVNTSNDFGYGSFFLNDSRRQATAFLVVRFKNLIYGFSYPKEYHPQIQNLINLISLEQ